MPEQPSQPEPFEWTVVRVVDLSTSRRRLDYVFGNGEKRHAVIDVELDTPERRQRIAEALYYEHFRVASTRGPEPRTPVKPSPWITS